jgi:hypothetical protein
MFGEDIGLWAEHKFEGHIGLVEHKKVEHTGLLVEHKFMGHIERVEHTKLLVGQSWCNWFSKG